MWIEIPDDVAEYLGRISNVLCKSSLAINTLLDSMLKGQHIVYMSRKLVDRIDKLDYINPSNKLFMRWIKQQYIYVYAGRDIVEYKIIVSTDSSEISVIGNNYIVPLDYFYDFRETKLLTENETDGKFFEYICHFIKKDKKTSDWYSVKFENDSCHGANVASKITQNAKENRIAICILDSDREMKGSAMGATYKGANNSFKRVKKNHIMLLSALESREKENLFPPSVYMLLCEEKRTLLMVLNQFIDEEKVIKYFDVKDGIKYKKYKINGWEQYYKPVIDELMKAGVYKLPNPEEVEDDFICMDGIGDKICDVLCQVLLGTETTFEEILSRRGVSEINRQEIRTVRDSFKEILPQYIYAEWEQLYRLLFSWGCCIDEKKMPNYQI